MDPLTAIPWGTLGPSGVVTLLVIGLFRGWIVTSRELDMVVADRDRERERADTLAATIPTLVTAVTGLTEGQEAANAMLAALQQARRPDDDLPPTHTVLGARP